MSTYLTTDGVLDSVLTIIQDNSTDVRAKFLAWLNRIMLMTAIERDWDCLNATASLTPSSSQITLPSDFHSFVSVSRAALFYLGPEDQLSDKEIADITIESSPTDLTIPMGFGLSSTKLTFYPGVSTTSVTLKYQKEVTTYTDGTTATVWPMRFYPLFERACLDFYYEYDMDERAALSYQLNKDQLKRLKNWENRQKPTKRMSNRGYTRVSR